MLVILIFITIFEYKLKNYEKSIINTNFYF
jgi:hypothetical protein